MITNPESYLANAVGLPLGDSCCAMTSAEKKALSERDICTKFITPALVGAQWDVMSQVREEVAFTKGRVIVRGRISARGEPQRADYLLSHKPGLPLGVIEAKDNNHSVGAGTGTGKTFVAFQIIWRLWKAGVKQRILFLADRNILVDQARVNDFKPFGGKLTKIGGRKIDKSYEVYLALYQAVSGTEDVQNIYRQFSPEFFDLVIVDECHRGSAAEDSAWREILTHFSGATQIGLTATPKETKAISNIEYFGDPIYTYSLRQGIADGFLAPYKVIRVDLDKDIDGWRPNPGQRDKYGQLIADRLYNQLDMDRELVLDERTKTVAWRITQYLKATDRFAKTIVFCEDIDHAERMRQALIMWNGAEVVKNHKYIMRITGDDPQGKAELDTFILPESKYPVIVTTSRLLNTGVDVRTCKLIVLDQRIESMTTFKQIIGRGTRILEDYGKTWFTIMDFKGATRLFADPDFDGEPVQIYEPDPDDPPTPPGRRRRG